MPKNDVDPRQYTNEQIDAAILVALNDRVATQNQRVRGGGNNPAGVSYWDSHTVAHAVLAQFLGVPPFQAGVTWDRFASKVTRRLEALRTRGDVIKYGRTEKVPHPNGSMMLPYGGGPVWQTPENDKLIREAHEKAVEDHNVAELHRVHREDRIRDQIQVIAPGVNAYENVDLDRNGVVHISANLLEVVLTKIEADS
jgi:hypothetical protein